MRCRGGRVRRLHYSGDNRNACDRTFRQHIHVVRIQAADRDDRDRHSAADIVQYGNRRYLGGDMRGGREDRARTEVVSTILIGRLCRLDRFCRRADDLVRAEQFSADRDRQIARTDVNACGIARNRNVYTVVNDERDLKAVCDRFDLLRQLQLRAAARLLLAKLNERRAAPAGLLDRVQQRFGRVIGAVRNDI